MKLSGITLFTLLVVMGGRVSAETKIRVGHFPNITHGQGLIAHALTRQGKGWFEERLGPDTKIEWFVYNAGPSAMEAIFANSIDLTYVGPGPALNAYTKSNGQEIRLIVGAANGGSGLIVQPDSNLKSPADFRGKKIATPQLGNTQDISCRAWLTEGGLKITQLGGDAQVLPTQNPDQLGLFKAKKIEAVWTVEPWLSRLEQEASGKVIVEETEVATTILVSSVKFLNQQRELAKKFAQAHAELTDWIAKNPEEAQRLIKAELLHEKRHGAPDHRRGLEANRFHIGNAAGLGREVHAKFGQGRFHQNCARFV
jgi:NitT/TauT family transport system substrate-binding protein